MSISGIMPWNLAAEPLSAVKAKAQGREIPSLRTGLLRSHIGTMQNLDLTDDEKLALVALLTRTIDGDRYPPVAARSHLKSILMTLRPKPVREPLPPPKVYALA